MTKTKEEGGLGLQSAKGRNIALLSKLNWRFHIESKAPWVQVLKKKYCSHRRRIASNANKLPCSPIWATMKRGMDTFNRGNRWMVGRDSKLNVWSSNWTKESPLRQLPKDPLLRKQVFWKSRTLCQTRVVIGRKYHLSYPKKSR